MAKAALHTPAVCDAREGRQNHRPDGTIVADGPHDEYSTCMDCGEDVARHWHDDDDEGGRYGWSRWSIAAKAVTA